MTEITFGCGEFLPGQGPFNFPDFSGGGTINAPSPDLEFDPRDPGTTSPPDIKECECRPKAVGTQSTFPLYTLGRFRYFVAQVEKDCTEIVNGFPADNSTEVIQTLQAAVAAIPRAQIINTEPGSEDCIDPEPQPGDPPPEEQDCNTKNCDPIRVFYRIPLDRDVGGPTTPDVTGGPSSISGPVYGVKDCICTIVNEVDSYEYILGKGQRITTRFFRRCVDRNKPNNPSQSSTSRIQEYINQLPANAIVEQRPSDTTDKRCRIVSNSCDPDPNFCGTLTVVYLIPNDTVETGGPTIPDPGPEGPPGEGPIRIPDPPDPGPTIPPNVGDPGVADPGGPTGPGVPPGSGPIRIPEPPDPGPTIPPNVGDPGAADPGDPPGPQVPPESGPISIPSPPGPGPGITNFVRIDDQTEAGGPTSNNILSSPSPPQANPNTVGESVTISKPPPPKEEDLNQLTEEELLRKTFSQTRINLSDPKVVNALLKKKPAGVEEEEVYFNVSPRRRKLVKNTSRKTNIFNRSIDESLLYLLERPLDYGNWDSQVAGTITPDIIYENLNDRAKEILSRVVNYDGSLLSRKQIYGIIGSRVLDGTIDKVNLSFLERLAQGSKDEDRFEIIPSQYQLVNESVALALIEKNYKPLDYSKYFGQGRELLKNKKTLSSDIDRYIEVTVAGEPRRYYVNDDDTFIGRSTLSLEDGEYFDVTLGGETTRLYAQSEKDHAFYVPEKTRQIAIELLGGTGDRFLSVSGDASSTIELSSTLTSPRQNAYFLSANLSSLSTELDPINPKYLKRTSLKYENCPISSIDAFNEYVKYKDNHQVFIVHDEDLILDYVETDGFLTLEQTDLILNSPKENKSIPLLTRQIPWYIILYPTNRPEYDVFNTKSQITNLTPSSVNQEPSLTRKLRTKTSIVKEFRDVPNLFVSNPYVGKEARDVFDEPDTQARINKIDIDSTVYGSGYKDSNGNVVAANQFAPARDKTGYRLLSEIIRNLDDNYLLGLNGIGKSLTEFDVLCRLTLRQFNKLYRMESYEQIKNSLFNGAVQNVKVVPATKNSDSKIANNKTQLVRRKSTAPAEDEFPEVKSTNFGRSLVPPTTDDDPTFGSFEPAPVPSPPTALP